MFTKIKPGVACLYRALAQGLLLLPCGLFLLVALAGAVYAVLAAGIGYGCFWLAESCLRLGKILSERDLSFWRSRSEINYFAHDHYAGYAGAARVGPPGRRHNNLGLRRETDTELAKPAGVFRLCLCGSSFLWGSGSSGAYRKIERSHPEVYDAPFLIDSLLERKLAASFPGQKFEALNCSCVGYWLHHHLLRYQTFLRRLAPDILLTIDGNNDLYQIRPNFRQFYSHPYLDTMLYPVTKPSLAGAFITLNRTVLPESDALNHFVRIIAGKQVLGLEEKLDTNDRALPRDEKYWAGAAQAFAEDAAPIYRQLAGALARDGADYLAALQPALYLRPAHLLQGKEPELLALYERINPGAFAERRRRYEISRQGVAALARECGFAHANLHDELEAVPRQLFVDYCHLTPDGLEETASALFRSLKPLVEKRLGRRGVVPALAEAASA